MNQTNEITTLPSYVQVAVMNYPLYEIVQSLGDSLCVTLGRCAYYIARGRFIADRMPDTFDIPESFFNVVFFIRVSSTTMMVMPCLQPSTSIRAMMAIRNGLGTRRQPSVRFTENRFFTEMPKSSSETYVLTDVIATLAVVHEDVFVKRRAYVRASVDVDRLNGLVARGPYARKGVALPHEPATSHQIERLKEKFHH